MTPRRNSLPRRSRNQVCDLRADGGTITDFLPFYPLRGWPAQHFPFEQTATYEVAAQLYNGNAVEAEYVLQLFDSAGRAAARERRIVGPHESLTVPMTTLLQGETAPGMYGLTVSPTLDSLGTWASIVVIDKQSGDRTTLW